MEKENGQNESPGRTITQYNMKITKSQLKRIVKEELESVLSEYDKLNKQRMLQLAKGKTKSGRTKERADLEAERRWTKREMERQARRAGKGQPTGWPDPDAFDDWNSGKIFAEFERKKEDIERACREQINVLRKEAHDAISAAAPWAGKESGESGGPGAWVRKQLEKLGLE